MKKVQTVLLVCMVLGIAGSFYYTWTQKPKIAYVNNGRVLTEYNGVKEAKKVYETQFSQWQANLDTLSLQVRKDIEEFQRLKEGMSEAEMQLTQELIQRKQSELMSYKNALEQKASENDQKLSKEVLNQIDSYIQEYGKKQGFDYIIGVADNGNLLYAKIEYDLTDEIIKSLNERYEGK